MILLLHAVFSGGCCLVLVVGWVISTYLVVRGSVIFVKAENKVRLVIIASLLMLICGVINFLLFKFDKDLFAFIEGIGVFAFPFGVFSGSPLFFITSMIYQKDMMMNQILLFCLGLLNFAAMIDFADKIEKQLVRK